MARACPLRSEPAHSIAMKVRCGRRGPKGRPCGRLLATGFADSTIPAPVVELSEEAVGYALEGLRSGFETIRSWALDDGPAFTANGQLFSLVATSGDDELRTSLAGRQHVVDSIPVVLACGCDRRNGIDRFVQVEGRLLLRELRRSTSTVRTDQLGAEHTVDAKLLLDILNPSQDSPRTTHLGPH